MDDTVKKYEHRQLARVCEHECNVGERYVVGVKTGGSRVGGPELSV